MFADRGHRKPEKKIAALLSYCQSHRYGFYTFRWLREGIYVCGSDEGHDDVSNFKEEKRVFFEVVNSLFGGNNFSHC